MAQRRPPRLQRVLQKIGLEKVIPNLKHASESELQAPFAKFLYHSECRGDLNICENFNPTTLPEIAFSEVKKTAEGIQSALMKPYISSMSMEEIMSLVSFKSLGAAFTKPPLDSDDFLACRVFFRVMVQGIEQNVHTVILNDLDHTLALIVHIKALRMLNSKANPEPVQRESKETLLLQVEYTWFAMEDTHWKEAEKMISDLIEHRPRNGMSRLVFGTKHQIHFIYQVLHAHERILDKTFVSEHDKLWMPRQKKNLIRPSFIVPLWPITACDEILQEIKDAAASSASGDKDVCAFCGKTDVKLKVCAACKTATYCSRECQISDWKSHEQTCRAVGNDAK